MRRSGLERRRSRTSPSRPRLPRLREQGPANQAPAVVQTKRLSSQQTGQRQDARFTFTSTLTRMERLIGEPSGPRARSPYGLRVTSRRTDKPPFTGASAHRWRASSASDGPEGFPFRQPVSVASAKHRHPRPRQPKLGNGFTSLAKLSGVPPRVLRRDACRYCRHSLTESSQAARFPPIDCRFPENSGRYCAPCQRAVPLARRASR